MRYRLRTLLTRELDQNAATAGAAGGARRRRWFQWSLRSFLISSTLLGIGLGCWFRPFVIETHRADGSLRTRFEVRRDWRGHVIASGKQQWFTHYGEAFIRTAYGERLGDDEFASLLMKDGDFDSLIWLICETVHPESWSDRSRCHCLTAMARN